ncbi:MAG TPA: carbon monoxide dehydrogenase subunit G [Acidiphilium sp.]|jgi:carbon monoxide dehydrogenase subunit G|uniref:SRPBCC family protein n=1 Tax=unclassified Acidiphilium TaxID=2617493 RepID=UPI000BCF08EA|nr:MULTISPECIES: carbon monoxide dehydrogenase subunit G [unclassified Acidiphilium]OYV56834.1 MAG: carbon monoxide dehydrogenase [Acidiphilium sp. 20-67-58]HQT60437.1 carbon monoxide dehydrogenase subunit G [Acidiphilium sp.]HQU10086.1 carbon monoxide dehydrogenase subunit G [Acidiphilium sp.]
MEMSGERLIAAPREAVWEALNDPDVLKACIQGCESIDKLSDTEMTATVAAKIGPISARFNGKVTLADLDPPNAYTISGEGQGGVAGFAKGGAKVQLADAEGGTKLTYQVSAQIGGKMAQLGARLIDSVAKSYAESFFTKFSEKVAPAPEAVPAPAPTPTKEIASMADHAHDHAHPAHGEDRSNPVIAGLPLGIWVPIIISAVVVALVLSKYIG